ncbi:hypothetical protein GTY56_07155 [Streptomyces sp. SID5643]|nr:hypothetical protein [Streptomyces sp. SID5643]
MARFEKQVRKKGLRGLHARDHGTRAPAPHHSAAPFVTGWTATLPATGYPLTRHATHPTTAHAAEESPG